MLLLRSKHNNNPCLENLLVIDFITSLTSVTYSSGVKSSPLGAALIYFAAMKEPPQDHLPHRTKTKLI